MTHNRLTQSLLAAALTLSLSGCIIHVGGHKDDNSGKSDYSSVFGGVEIEQNRHVGDLSSVNGNVEMADNSSAKDVDAVNGNIELGKNVSVAELSTVNGNIETEQNLTVKRDVSTVNGTIRFGKNSHIGGDVTTVNGDIHLTQTTVDDDLKTKNGSITLTQNSVVQGDIEFEAQHDNSWWSDKSQDYSPPVLTIDASSNVKGKIILRQVVILEIENPDLLAKVERHYKGQE